MPGSARLLFRDLGRPISSGRQCSGDFLPRSQEHGAAAAEASQEKISKGRATFRHFQEFLLRTAARRAGRAVYHRRDYRYVGEFAQGISVPLRLSEQAATDG